MKTICGWAGDHSNSVLGVYMHFLARNQSILSDTAVRSKHEVRSQVSRRSYPDLGVRRTGRLCLRLFLRSKRRSQRTKGSRNAQGN